MCCAFDKKQRCVTTLYRGVQGPSPLPLTICAPSLALALPASCPVDRVYSCRADAEAVVAGVVGASLAVRDVLEYMSDGGSAGGGGKNPIGTLLLYNCDGAVGACMLLYGEGPVAGIPAKFPGI